MIRGRFPNIDPLTLSDQEFADNLAQALWLSHFEKEQLKNAVLEALAVAFKKM